MTNKEIHTALSNLKIGDKLAINDFKAKYTVCGLSPRFALAHYGKYYTILSRVPVNCAGYNHHGVRNGDFVCAPDWWAFGYVGGYHFTDEDWVKDYMLQLESGQTEQSVRKEAPIWFLSVVGHRDNVYAKRKLVET